MSMIQKLLSKRTWLILILELIFVCNSFSQMYVPFPSSNAIWRQSANRYNGTSNTCWDYQLYIKGDTIINGTPYHNIYMSGTWGPFCNNATYNNPSAAIREDLNKHIYVYSYFDSAEHLLYDFNLSVGDTLPNPQPYAWNPYLSNENKIITLIDSVQVGGTFRKEYWCSDTTWMGGCNSSQCINYVALIEGIGSTYGLFGDLSPNWGEKDDLLLCFKLNGQNLYPVGATCNLVSVGIDEATKNDFPIKIYPNPANDFLNIQFADEQTSLIKICNSFGKEVITKDLFGNNKLNQIQLKNLTDGIYFWKLMSGKEIKASGKVVIMK